MYMWTKIGFCVGLVLFSQTMSGQSLEPEFIPYSALPQKKMRLLFDYYHHGLPSTKVGNYIMTGSWIDNNGRYGWNDFVHTNTMDHAYLVLDEEFSISMGLAPFTRKTLSQTDGVVIIAADNPAYVTNAKLISDSEISALREFVSQGGSLMVMLNGGGAGRFSESFESVQLRKLVTGFGLSWNDDDTHYSDVTVPANHPYFFDVSVFHYGAGCTINTLPKAQNPEVLMEVYSDDGYPDRSVRGPGIVLVRFGKGKFLLVGDAGSWTGNLSRPWADNVRFMKQLFRYMKPDRGVKPADLSKYPNLSYEMTVASLQAIPVANSLSKIERTVYRNFSPRETTNIPYVEATGVLSVSTQKQPGTNGYSVGIDITNFRWFDDLQRDSQIRLDVNRQGKVNIIIPEDNIARWISPDIPLLFALLPVDGLQPGDTWDSVEPIRIPTLRGNDPNETTRIEMKLTYIGNVEHEKKKTRLIRASGEFWLNELGLQLRDILTDEVMKQSGLHQYHFFHERGGKIIFRREQWVDMETGLVVEAKNQVRLIAWIKDKDKPVGNNNADKDNEMIVSLAHVTQLKLKP